MLVSARVARALDERRDAFQTAATRAAELASTYDRALDDLASLSVAEIEERVAFEPWPGARPTRELAERGLVVPFGVEWQTAQEARAWALERLRGVPVVGVDGSQVAASKEFGVPISLVQVSHFVNYHDPDRPYIKDVTNEIVTAEEVLEEAEEYFLAESRVNQRRFELEMEVAAHWLQRLDPADRPVVLFDGTFVLSFIRPMKPAARQVYLAALFRLLDASRETGIPVIGYVDLSLATDLVSLLRFTFELPQGSIFDAALLEGRLETLDRTAAFVSARHDVMHLYRTESRDYTRDLHFIYLKTGADRLPARLDVPAWVLDAGMLDHVTDVVRAEIVVGSGYPYAIETADAAAVLTVEDRMTFYRLFHDFAQRSGLSHLLPAKSLSKSRRR